MPRLFRNGRTIRLVIAFLVGLLLGFFAYGISTDLQNLLPFVLFPFLIGVAGACTVSGRNPHPHLLALGTGLLIWGGVGVSLLILTVYVALAPCGGENCGSTTSSILASLLIFYLLGGLALVTAGSLLTSGLLRRFRRTR